ncbi:CDGSH iron-sulfur domain-containing protein 2 homolog [Linepithema humile]|uniref:CDGSH iron-sulfur domain-containing protein 2 homolog n=1 Tax=Linepithema humile TaxID=83485 RepID=UPI0006235D7B|nr:PREDICTED: CDGSH iron-sulfur domain-containing protein 2 homolog [Linepithema humile]
MEPFAHLVKKSVPNYLAALPIPDSIGGWFRLGVRDWLALLPPTALLVGFGYMSYRAFCPHGRPVPCGRVNLKVRKDVAKVVDTVDIEDISEKAVFCRCWRSENWPYCDGTHGRHNNEHGDNVGPLVITNKKA